MPTRPQVLTLLRDGSDYREVAERLGVPPGQAYMIATGRWPRLSDSLARAEAGRLAERWQTARAAAPTCPHPHLASDPRLLGAAMPVLAVADRALDAMRARMPLVGA